MTYPSGRVVTVNVATAITQMPMSNLLAGMTHGNGLTPTATYDTDYRLTQLQVKNGSAVVSGYLTGITDQVLAANSVSLWHNVANRLEGACPGFQDCDCVFSAISARLVC